VVFAFHFYAVWLIVFCALVPILALALVAFVFVSGIRLSPSTMDIVVSYVLVGCAAAYLFVAAGRVYAERGVGRLVKVLILAIASGFTVIGYRFVVFLITLYTTGSH
jgi:hypothetical protein